MHVSMMHIYMTLDPDACMNDAYVSKILYPDTCIHDAGFFPDGRTDRPTNGQADSRSWIQYYCMILQGISRYCIELD